MIRLPCILALVSFVAVLVAAPGASAAPPDAVPILTRQLADKSKTVQEKAARRLGRTRDARAVAPLVQALQSPDDQIREAAAQSLGKLGKPALKALIQTLRHKDPLVRRYAIDALGDLRDRRAVIPLTQLLKAEELPEGLVEALGKIADPRAIGPLLDAAPRWDSTEDVLAGALSAPGEAAIAPLTQGLSHPEPAARAFAAKALAQVGGPGAIEAILPLLTDPSPVAQGMAAEALGGVADPNCFDPLYAALQKAPAAKGAYDNVASLCRSALAEALGRTGDPRAIAILIPLLQDKDDDVQEAAARGLALSGNSECVSAIVAAAMASDSGRAGDDIWAASHATGRQLDPWLEMANDPDPERRGLAISMFAYVEEPNDPRVMPAIECAAGDPDAVIRADAVAAMARAKVPGLAGVIATALTDSDRRVRREAANAINSLEDGSTLIEPLLKAAHDTDLEVRTAAIGALTACRDPRLPALFAELVQEGKACLRSLAARGLLGLEKPPMDTLRPLLDDPDQDVRETVLYGMCRAGDHQAIDRLVANLKSAGQLDRFGQLDDLTSPYAIKRLRTLIGVERLRVPVLCALARLGDKQVLQPLVEVLRENKAALAVHLEGPVPPDLSMSECLDSPSYRLDAAAEALGYLRDPLSTKVLLEGLGDESTCVMGSLARLKDPACIDPLIKSLADPENRNRWDTADVLSLFDDERVAKLMRRSLDDWDLDVVGGGWRYYVRHGIQDAVQALQDALWEQGDGWFDDAITPGFIACGNKQLAKAAREWAVANDMEEDSWVMQVRTDGLPYPRWGEASGD